MEDNRVTGCLFQFENGMRNWKNSGKHFYSCKHILRRTPETTGVSCYSDATVFASAFKTPIVIIEFGEVGLSGIADEYVEIDYLMKANRIFTQIALDNLKKLIEVTGKDNMNNKIYDELKNKILFLELQPGETIDEKKLAAEFKVSRTPVREVLQKLEWEGLVDIVPRGAISVVTLEYNKIKDAYFMRVQVEGLAGKLAAAHGKPIHVSQIKSILEVILSLDQDVSAKQLMDIDVSFRNVLYAATGNCVIKQVSDMLYEKTIRIWLSHMQSDHENNIIIKEKDYLIEEIETVAETIENRLTDKAEQDRRNIIIRQIVRANDYFMQDIQNY